MSGGHEWSSYGDARDWGYSGGGASGAGNMSVQNRGSGQAGGGVATDQLTFSETSTMNMIAEIPVDETYKVDVQFYEKMLELESDRFSFEQEGAQVYESDPAALALITPGYRIAIGSVNSSKTWYAWGPFPYINSSTTIRDGYCMEVFSDYSYSVSYTPMLYEMLTWTEYHTYMEAGVDTIFLEAGSYSGIDRTALGLSVSQFGVQGGSSATGRTGELENTLGDDDNFWQALANSGQLADGSLNPSSGLRDDGEAFVKFDFDLNSDVTLEIPNYTYVSTYDYSGATLTEYNVGQINLPPGAIGLLGKYEGNVGTDDQLPQTTHGFAHNHEYVTSNNETDLSFYYYNSLPDSLVDFDVEWDMGADEYLRYRTLVLTTDGAEAGFIKSMFGSGVSGTTTEQISISFDNQMASIANQIYGLISTERYAYKRTKPLMLDSNELQEFGAPEAPQNMGIAAITGSY